LLVLESTSGAGATDYIALQTASQTERMRILTGGNVGIGTSTPQDLLHVNYNTTQNITNLIAGIQVDLANSVTGGIQIDTFGTSANPQITMRGAVGTAASPTATASGNFLFILDAEGYSGSVYSGQGLWASVAAETWGSTNRGTYAVVHTTPIGSTTRTEAIRVQASGGLSVGTTTDPGIGSLQLNAQEFIPNVLSDAGIADSTACIRTSNGQILKGSGTIGICLGTSSARYKDRIVDLQDGLDQLDELRSVNFHYKPDMGHDPEKMQYGFIAEDVYKVLPGLVDVDDQGRPNTVDILGMVPILVKAVQQLKADNDDLRKSVEELRKR
jgi:hypothetical protein